MTVNRSSNGVSFLKCNAQFFRMPCAWVKKQEQCPTMFIMGIGTFMHNVGPLLQVE